ncbi:unnamed protein product [Lactuca virosa]|uniref:Uncharacterized protein n=1 Tax=Lactuca virosa TaxID=75947 RepID=A0AAU9N4H5_9ASTR|nr:unnamed protein product [Lactuca virosa]
MADVLQIPSFLWRYTGFLVGSASTDEIISTCVIDGVVPIETGSFTSGTSALVIFFKKLCQGLHVKPATDFVHEQLKTDRSTIVLDRHLLAEDIVYVFLCCYCGFGNILAYWSNCMYLT